MSEFRSLICLTTCNRELFVRRYAPHYLAYCRANRRFDFLIALDGCDAASIEVASRRGLPLLYSHEREGVGLSKNRVLTRFGDYDYYFFIDDDAELLDGRVFPEHVRISQESGFHHLTLFERGGARGVVREEHVAGHALQFARYGGGQFSFFTRQGLQRVGGWHTAFAEYRRFGHTEHSWRFVNAGLAETPFVVATTLSECLLWHYPPSVTSKTNLAVNPASHLSSREEALISEQLAFFPTQTLCGFDFNGIALDGSQAPWLDSLQVDRYPLLSVHERRAARADHFAALSRTQRGGSRALSILRAAWNEPMNPQLRHAVKYWITRQDA